MPISDGGPCGFNPAPTTNPYTLPGTVIVEQSTDALALQLRAHSQIRSQLNIVEAYYFRDAQWNKFTNQIILDKGKGVSIAYAYRTPAIATFAFKDQDGLLTRENMNSPLNINLSSVYDPILELHRKILLRHGKFCYDNLASGKLPTSTLTPSNTIPGTSAPTIAGSFSSGGSPGLGSANYYYVVTATGPSGESLASNEYNSGLIPNGSKVTLTWSAITGATTYTIYRSTSTGTETKLDTTTSLSYVDQGVHTPDGTTHPPATSGGSALTYLTDNLLGNIVTNNNNFCQFTPASATPFTITVDLGSVQDIKCAVIRFAARTAPATATLPASVQLGLSLNNISYKDYPIRPIAGNTSLSGDWDNADVGKSNYEIVFTNISDSARYIQFIITPTGAQTIFVDELAIYGGNHGQYVGRNKFVGYLGAGINPDPMGIINISAHDITSKLIYNNEVRLTTAFSNTDASDIIYAMLTGGNYWFGTTVGAYDAPWPGSQINWASGTAYTGAVIPTYQGQGNNLRGYVSDIEKMIGMEFYADGNGYASLRQPPFFQWIPDRVLIAAPDGNYDAMNAVRIYDDKDIRNVVEIAVGDPLKGAARLVKKNRASITKYGRLRNIVTDSLMSDSAVRNQMADYILRDYSFDICEFNAEFLSDAQTHLRSVLGVRTAGRSNLAAKNSAVTGDKHAQELWSLVSYTEEITIDKCKAVGKFRPYFPQNVQSPLNITAVPVAGDATKVDVSWTQPYNLTNIQGYRIYISSISETSGFTQVYSGAGYVSPQRITGLTGGVQYWVYVVGYDQNGNEGSESSTVSFIAGTSPGDESNWAVTDLTGSYNSVNTPVSPDIYYTYQISLLWTSPPLSRVGLTDDGRYGFKHAEFRFAVDTQPSGAAGSPTDVNNPAAWQYQDEWHGDRFAPGMGNLWNHGTSGQLNWNFRFRTTSNLSGHTIYIVMFTWQTSEGEHGPSHRSNIIAVTIP